MVSIVIATITATSDSSRVTLTVSDPRGRDSGKETGDKKLEVKLDTKAGGQHNICIGNQDGRSVKVDIQIKSSEFSSQASDTITKKHLRPVEV